MNLSSQYNIGMLNCQKEGQVYNMTPSKSSLTYKSFLLQDEMTYTEEIKSESSHNGSKIFDQSFNSHEIYTETEYDEDQQYYYPKMIDMNKNNLELKRVFSKIELKNSSTEFEAFLLIAKYFFSVGILALPYMFQLTGYLLGSLLIIFTAVMTVYSVHLITDVHQDMIEKEEQNQLNQNQHNQHNHHNHHNQNNHQHPPHKLNASITDVAYRVFGVPGQITCRIFSAINNLGGCISYIIFFEIYISQIIQQTWMKNISNEQAHLVGALVAFAIILPFSTVNHLSLFWQTNLIGFFFGFTAIICMVYLDCSFIYEIGGIKPSENDLWKTDHLFIAIGIVVYSLQIIPIALNVRDCMEKPQHFLPVFRVSTFFTCMVYLVFGLITHYAIGEYVDDVVLLNFAPQTVLGFFVRFFYTISILLSYPLKFYVVIQIYENLKIYKEKVFCQEKYDKQEYPCVYASHIALVKRYALRYALILSIFILSLTTLKLAKLISLLGSLGALVLQFIIPQLIYMKYFNVSLPRVILGMIICLIFLIAACLGVYRSIENF